MDLLQGAIRGSWKAPVIVKTKKVWLSSHPRKLQPCLLQRPTQMNLIWNALDPELWRDYANLCTGSPVSSIFIFPTPTFMYFSGSTSELPWKCESILLSAWEVGWEVAHLHLKQQALLSGAQNRPVETGWKSTPALHPGSSWITALHGVVLKGPKWIQRPGLMRGGHRNTPLSFHSHSSHPQNPLTSLVLSRVSHFFIPWIIPEPLMSWPICVSKEERVALNI